MKRPIRLIGHCSGSPQVISSGVTLAKADASFLDFLTPEFVPSHMVPFDDFSREGGLFIVDLELEDEPLKLLTPTGTCK